MRGLGQRPRITPRDSSRQRTAAAIRSGAGARVTYWQQVRSASIQQEGERLRRSPSLSLCPISRVMDAELKHRDHEGITPVNPISVLGKAVRLVQSVPVPAPIGVIDLCRALAIALAALELLRDKTTDKLLTNCH